jgi:3-hydroxyacyl-CoA dehydrogenase / enoyl-CoA hydratase / 3-hydroxybutyryl-CoA epimerase
MNMGPLRCLDLVNLDLAVRIADQTRAQLGEHYQDHPGVDVARKLVEAGRTGAKVGKGCFEHGDGDPRLWPGLSQLFPLSETQPDPASVQERLMMVQALETIRAFEDGIVKRTVDADLGSILEWGFAPNTGGIASYIDALSPAKLVEKAAWLSQSAGPRFAPPAMLAQMAKDATSLASHHAPTS